MLHFCLRRILRPKRVKLLSLSNELDKLVRNAFSQPIDTRF